MLILQLLALFPAQAATTNLSCQLTASANRTALVNAVNAANSNGGDDTINLPANCTYELTSALNITDTTGSLTINGTAVNRPSIDGGDGTFLFQIQPNAELIVNQVDLVDGQSFSANGGAIVNQGDLTLSDLNMSSHESGALGGAIYNNGGTVTAVTVAFTQNSASDDGGVIYNDGGTITTSNDTFFVNNSAVTSGGGIYNTSGGTLDLDDAYFADNTANFGAGIYNAGTLEITTTSEFQSNTADFGGGGGGLYNTGTATLDDTTFTTNTVDAPGDAFEDDRLDGGGIYNTGTLTITNGLFQFNQADGRGGGVYNEGGIVSITDTDFTSNSNTDVNSRGGGGIYNYQGSLTVNGGTFFDNWRSGIVTRGESGSLATLNVSNATFDANGAPEGTGIQSSYSNVTLDNTAFTNSNFTNSGGGMRLWQSTVTMTGGNFTANSASQGGAIYILSDVTLNIDGTTFTDNTADTGGAIYIYETGNVTVNIDNASFDQNDATFDYGGAIYNGPASTVNIDNTDFDFNTAETNGGALYNEGGTVTITNGSTFDDNLSEGVGFSEGGGALFTTHEDGNTSNGGDLTIEDSFFNRNTSNAKGGAIYSISNNVTITNTRIAENRGLLANINTGGGALFASNSTVTLSFVKFPDNLAPDGSGGAVFMGGGTLNASDSFFNFNAAAGAGAVHLDFATATFERVFMYENDGNTGAMYVLGGETEIINSTISSNSSVTFVGGIYTQDDNDMTMRNVTLVFNQGANTGGVYANHNASGSFNIDNSIVALNVSTSGDRDVNGTLNSNGYNIITNPGTATITGDTATNLDTDPLIGAAQDNGGFTWTHALLAGSPAIDGGNCVLTEDQRLEPRPQDIPTVTDVVNGCDIGAFELSAPATPTPTSTATPTDDPGATPTATPTSDPGVTATPTPTDDPGAMPTPTAPGGATGTPTGTPTDDPNATPTVNPSATPLPENVSITDDLEAPVYPTFSWPKDPDADWYRITITDQDGLDVFEKWLPAAEVCPDDTCTYMLTEDDLAIGLVNGSYTVTIFAWDAGTQAVTPVGEGGFEVSIPEASAPTTTSVDASTGRPIITFPNDPAVSWWHIYIGSPDFSQTVDLAWYPKSAADCDATTCTLIPNAHPTNGNWVLYLRNWGPAGFGGGDPTVWTGPLAFTLNVAPATPLDPLTVTISDGQPTFTWNASENATWYQFWFGPEDYSETLYLQWLPATALGCNGGGVCTLTLQDQALVLNQRYEWWGRAWGPGGMSLGSWQLGGSFQP